MKTTIKRVLLLAVCLQFVVCFAEAQAPGNAMLRKDIQKILDTVNGKMGISVCGLNFDDTLSVNGRDHFPMLSVYKFPLAIAVLDKADKKELSLTRKYVIAANSLDTATWSPMVRDFKGRDTTLTIAELLLYSVSKSDNNACDILFNIAGGTKHVNRFLHKAGVTKISIAATEAEMKTAEKVQFTNWCEPVAMTQLLQLFYKGKLLTQSANRLLMKLMTESENSDKRLIGMLPPAAVVAHKTGTSNVSTDGSNPAINDAGIISLPNGKTYAITIFLTGYRGPFEGGEAAIAAVSKAIWDAYGR